jgi:hypothetical protein
MEAGRLKDPRPLENMAGIMFTLLIFYGLALMFVAGILLFVGSYLFSMLFEDTLFTQDEFILAQGSLIYIIGGIILIFALIPLGVMKRKWNSYQENEPRKEIWPYGIAAGIFAAWILTGAFSLSGNEEYFIFATFGPFLLLIGLMNWKVVDIPSKVLAELGNQKALKLSRDAAIPVVILLFSFIPMVHAISFLDAPVVTIFIIYMEVLFAGGVITTFVCMVVLYGKLKKMAKVLREEKRIETEHYMDRLIDLNIERS